MRINLLTKQDVAIAVEVAHKALDEAYDTARGMRDLDSDRMERGYKWARALHDEYDRQMGMVFGNYDIIYCAPREYGSDVMARIALAYFKANPDCRYVMVHEHGGWRLGYRRDGSIFSTANDMAVLEQPFPKPYTYSGVCIRREQRAA